MTSYKKKVEELERQLEVQKEKHDLLKALVFGLYVKADRAYKSERFNTTCLMSNPPQSDGVRNMWIAWWQALDQIKKEVQL